jgi:hypothetical protein
MTNFLKEPCTAIFSGVTGCGKTVKVLDLLQSEYKHHFFNIVILCSTLRWNRSYLDRQWVWKDPYIFCIEPKDKLFDWIERLGTLLAGEETLFIVDDVIADESLDKRRQSLLELAISGRHKKHSLWLLTQSYNAIPKNIRRQCKMLFLWYPKERSDLKLVDEESNIIEDWTAIKQQLQQSKHACLYLRLEFPRSFSVLE